MGLFGKMARSEQQLGSSISRASSLRICSRGHSAVLPLRVFLAHPLNEITQATIDLRAPCQLSRFPAPESFPARAMPPQDGLRLNHLGHTEQARPEPGHPCQQCPVTAAQSKARRRTPQGDAELMTEKQVLGLKPATRLEQVGEEHSERV